jgi:hypothetical protein
VLSGVEAKADGSVVGVMADELPVDRAGENGKWIFTPRLIELCFQTAGVYEIGLTGQMGLPAGVERVTVRETPSASTPLVAEIRPTKGSGNGSGSSLRFDAQVKGADGRVYVELTGYRTSTMPGGLPEPELAPFRAVGQATE